MEKESVKAMAPLVLAYLGDAVYELIIRDRLVRLDTSRPKVLNRRAAGLVCAGAQSAMMTVIEPLLTEDEAAVYRRGRNANSPTKAKNQSIQDYRRATGFEALVGYLHLCEDNERLHFLIDEGLKGLEAARTIED
ncbi:MAG: ribonuclease III domain-containing protein [Lachnospiraceae bacterium]|nr:ribonuclease III domain-containing protein [Lachnospiraceae bacterium]